MLQSSKEGPYTAMSFSGRAWDSLIRPIFDHVFIYFGSFSELFIIGAVHNTLAVKMRMVPTSCNIHNVHVQCRCFLKREVVASSTLGVVISLAHI